MSALAKLNEARMKMLSLAIKKGGKNEFAKYNYLRMDDFLPQALQAFNELKLCGVISFGKELATLTITDLEDGSTVEITSPMSTASLKGCHEVQNLGSVQTYLRRYLWVAALEILEHDPIDTSNPDENMIAMLEDAANNGMETLLKEWKKIAKQFTDTSEMDAFWAKNGKHLKEMAMKKEAENGAKIG